VKGGAILAAGLAIALFAGAFVPTAQADGDPASDYLLAQSVFFPLAGLLPVDQQEALRSVVRTANRAGFEIRVAVIATRYDMGAATALFGHPSEYARFLGEELSFLYRNRLLVVMPNGFGFNWPKHSTVAADAELAKIPIQPGTAGLLTAATSAVVRLAAVEHVELAPSAPAAASHTTRDRILIIAATLAAISAAAATRFALRRRRT